MNPNKLPTNNMADATPTRKMFKASATNPVNLQVTPQTKTGDLAFLRSQGISSVTLSGQRKRR